MSHNKIFFLNQSQMPTHYYNILADVPVQMDPPLHPGTKKPAGPQDLSTDIPNGAYQTGSYSRTIHRNSG